ncbi:hypothetical protein DSO57_1014515 [Entomophthora muscae]|uniref:Uncharacterized protein n=1 Tax=Entomophthora muscae TaxID=34485 RepID=A0ACC2T5L8_9FUNG|nr:hypothetical protein DSO57_1014515 [Entomophthora muscae]
MSLYPNWEIQLFGFLILRNSLAPLMLAVSDPTVHVLFCGPQGFPVVCLCHASENDTLDHTNKLFGIVYITLTGVIDTIVPAAGLWSWLGKSMSYFIKLAPIHWWALPTQSATYQSPNTSKPANQGWFPEIN